MFGVLEKVKKSKWRSEKRIEKKGIKEENVGLFVCVWYFVEILWFKNL